MRKCSRAKEQSLSLLTQQAWDSAKSNMSEKAVDRVRGYRAEMCQVNFLHVIIFKNYECSNMFAEARLFSKPFLCFVGECEHLV